MLMACFAALRATEPQQLQLRMKGLNIIDYTQSKIRDVLYAVLVNPTTTFVNPHKVGGEPK